MQWWKICQRIGYNRVCSDSLAIIQVESGGTMEDVMQSSESAGLPPNSLSTEASIKQGCLYFASLVKRSKELGCDQDSIIQAYNFGGGYLDYVAKTGRSIVLL